MTNGEKITASHILSSQSLNAPLAQWLERYSLKVFVIGSNPIWSTIFSPLGQDIRLAYSSGSRPDSATNCPNSLTAKTNRLPTPVDGGSIPSLGTIFGQRGNSVAPRSRTSVDHHFALVAQLVQMKNRTEYVQDIHNLQEGGCGGQRVCLFQSGDGKPSERRFQESEVEGSNPSRGTNL